MKSNLIDIYVILSFTSSVSSTLKSYFINITKIYISFRLRAKIISKNNSRNLTSFKLILIDQNSDFLSLLRKRVKIVVLVESFSQTLVLSEYVRIYETIIKNVIIIIYKIIMILKNKNLNRLKFLNKLYALYKKSYNKIIRMRENLKKNELRELI